MDPNLNRSTQAGHAGAGGGVLLLLIAGTLLFPLSFLLLVQPDGTGPLPFQVGYALASVAWLTAIWRAGHMSRLPLGWILVAALLARVLLLPAPVSDDVYRYVSEGLARLHGLNPYVYPPDAPELEAIRTDWWPRINHPNHAGIYPPTAQAIFTVWAAVYPDPTACKYALLTCELGAIGLLIGWLRRAGRDPGWVLVYALCPAALNAIAREGHLDALLVLGLCLLGWATAGRTVRGLDLFWAGCGLGLAVGSKWVAVLLLPWTVWWLLRDADRRRRVGWWLAGIGLTFALPACFYLDHGVAIWFGPLRHFAEQFHSLDYLRQQLLPWLGKDGFRILAVLVLLAGCAGTLRAGLARCQVWMFGLLLLVSPTLHPWYVVWLLPGLTLLRRSVWLILPLSLVFAFEADRLRHATGVWQQPEWVAAAVHLPVYAGLLVLAAYRAAGLGKRRDSATLSP